ncbi:lysylphosphatidylglycerol synthase transmembrane domain-containing protein [Gemmatimonas sp.]|uniref:lysylphosphatidylglycerol synthase transmembrane domain-containing protein n=1 Tax=Gemmatimonas sp. TaxID=1962908 RepID=UPI003983ACB9
MKVDWKSGLGFAFSAVLLWWSLKGVNLGDVWSVLRTSNVLLFALSPIVGTCIFPLRARRWRTILEPVAGRIAFGPLWRSTAIGMMMNNVFPFRAGEFARAFSLTREVPRLPVTTALGSLAVDRIFDAIVIFAMMFAAMLDPRFPSGVTLAGRTVPQLAQFGVAAMLVLLVVCYAMVMQAPRVLSIVRWFAHRVLPRFADAIVGFVENAMGGLAVLRDGRRFLAVLGWAIAHWVVNALAMYIGFVAVGMDIPISAAFFLQGVVALAVAVPSSPGFFGVFELSSVLGLAVYGVNDKLAVSWALAYHLLSFIPITIIGAVYFARLGLSVGTLSGKRTEVARS